MLSYYKRDEQLEVQCDSSQSVLCAVLMQNRHLFAYTRRALVVSVFFYAQIEEMLAIVFTVEKFNDYTFCGMTVVFSDHKPLESIFKKLVHHVPKRLQGMIIRWQKYDIEVRYEKENRMFLADTHPI